MKIALNLAELAGRRLMLEKAVKNILTESQVVNEWIIEGQVQLLQQMLLKLLTSRFPFELNEETRQAVYDTDSLELSDDWFDKALQCASFADFLAVLRG